ncbi:MAG: hypothetical protein JXA41_08145 [Deltaproteobacteria bacterium]|nr:hypothetical protein [Deltaproteobacteria bacterium]
MENKKYYPEEDEIDLLELWQVIVKRKKMIIIMVVAAVFLTAFLSLFMTNIYQSKTMIIPITPRDAGRGGTMSMLAEQFGGLAAMGISTPGAASASEIVNLLKSNILREKIITKYHLLPVLFYDQYNWETKKWKIEEEGPSFSINPFKLIGKLVALVRPADPGAPKKEDDGIPGIWDGLRALKTIVNVNHDIKENSITLSVDLYDPEQAKKIVEYFLQTLTDHMSFEAKRVALTNRKYLESQLNETSDPLIKQKIYNLIAQQIETSMMSEVKENFAFKVIDPPMTPDLKIKPRRSIMVILAFMTALFIGILAAFFLEFLEKAKKKQEEEKTV